MKRCWITLLVCLSIAQVKAQLVINELSQGPTGTKEYVELVVTGTVSCGGTNTVDLRGWIIDDNNSWHASGSGTGIATGHAKFDSIPQWANVKIGAIILIYNDADVSPATAALSPDETDANSDCVYIVPISSSSILKNVTLPTSGGTMTTYAVAGTPYTTTGTWPPLGMANSDDAFHTVSPSNYAVPYHAIGWGNNTAQVNVYFAAGQGGQVIYMANTVDNDPFNQANFVNASATTNETPGAPNNAANALWIGQMNNNCQPFTVPTTSRNVSLCPGQSILINGVTVTAAGTYTDTLPAITGCDTVRTTTVTMGSSINDSQNVSLCQGKQTIINGQTITTSGTYYDTIPSISGCDTIRAYVVTVNPYLQKSVPLSICTGQSVVINGQTITTAGTYYDTIPAISSCDTIVTYTVTISPFIQKTLPVSLCTGQSITINGQTITTNGNYLDTLSAISGCDTIVTYQVTFNSYITANASFTICPGQSATFNGQQYSTAGTYFDTIPALSGCDTAYTITVTIGGFINATQQVQLCNGSTFTVNGVAYTAPNTVIDTISSVNSCDTIMTYNLVVVASFATTNTPTICEGTSYFAGGALQTTGGTYVDTLTSTGGCDSIVTTILTVEPLPVAQVTGDTIINAGETATLAASGGTSYVWSSGETTAQISISPSQSTYYIVTVASNANCTDSAGIFVQVNVIEEPLPLVPTAFSPNGDGVNDVFNIVNRDKFTVNIFHIYNRWGELIFKDTSSGWDGTYKQTEQPIGTYIYYLSVKSITTNKQHTLSGNVTLLR
ncbi:MAG: gliding motility-associated C-terminal domain-containing protein [Chitinophagales bacterium]